MTFTFIREDTSPLLVFAGQRYPLPWHEGAINTLQQKSRFVRLNSRLMRYCVMHNWYLSSKLSVLSPLCSEILILWSKRMLLGVRWNEWFDPLSENPWQVLAIARLIVMPKKTERITSVC